MNDFKLDIRHLGPDVADVEDEVVIYIDGRPLLDLVAEAERPFAKIEGAGRYVGPPPDVALLPSRHFLGEPVTDPNWGDEWFSRAGRVAVAGCGCGNVGCWPLVVSIDAGPDVLVWRDFHNPHRARPLLNRKWARRTAWDCSALGPFTFDRQQYEAELAQPSGPPGASTRL